MLIAQEYGLQVAWRKHFDWLLPFFRHPKYIRSNGRIQFVVYNPTHIGHIGPQMFAAWRQWAVEEGLGGMDIIETRWGEGSDKGPDSWEGYPPDAVNEFAPHAGGRDQATFSSLKKMTRVYHRGTLVSSLIWIPRHVLGCISISEKLGLVFVPSLTINTVLKICAHKLTELLEPGMLGYYPSSSNGPPRGVLAHLPSQNMATPSG